MCVSEYVGELAVLRFKPMAVTSVAMSSENICCWNKYLCVTLLHCCVFVFYEVCHLYPKAVSVATQFIY